MRILSAVLCAGAIAGILPTVQAQAPGTCDRACLEAIADQYLAAMVAHDAAKAPFASDPIFTENTIRLPLTEGLWYTASGVGDYRFYVSDPVTGQVAWTGIAKEHDKPVILSVRLKVVARQITEAESIVVRNVNDKSLANLTTPPPAMAQALAPSERVSRDEMIRISHSYFDAIEKLSDRDVPFADECYRLENGALTAGALPGAGPETPARERCAHGDIPPILKTIANIRPRRTLVIDEERGITWGVYCFNHRGLASVTLPDGTVQPTYFQSPNSMAVAEMFKIQGGKIYDILGFGATLPYGIGDGWTGPLFQ